MKTYAKSPSAHVLVALVAALGTAGCTDSREDVRLTLCKDLVITQIAPSSSVTWIDAKTETRGYEYAAARLKFSTQSGEGQAVCYYKYNAVDDTALTLSDPLSAYSTSPYEMNLNGTTLSRPALAEAIKKAMLMQGSRVFSGAR